MYCMHICAMLTHKSRPMIDSKSETPLLKMQSRDFPIVPFQTLRSNVKCVCEWLPADYWLYFFAGFHLLRKVPAFERRNKKMCHYCVLIQKFFWQSETFLHLTGRKMGVRNQFLSRILFVTWKISEKKSFERDFGKIGFDQFLFIYFC